MITVYGIEGNLATVALLKCLANNQLAYKYIEITDDMKFIHVVPTINITKNNASYALHGFSIDTLNKILGILSQ